MKDLRNFLLLGATSRNCNHRNKLCPRKQISCCQGQQNNMVTMETRKHGYYGQKIMVTKQKIVVAIETTQKILV